MINEISQTRKEHDMIPLTCAPRNRQIHRKRKQNRSYQDLGVREKEKLLVNGYSIYVWNDEKVYGIHSGDSHTTL